MSPPPHAPQTATESPLPLHIPSGGGPAISILGLETTVKISARDSGGLMLLAEQTVVPGMGVPPHVHTREDEVFFVLDGEIEFVLGDRTFVGKAGDVVQAPRGVVHGYLGSGDRPARAYFMAIPAGIEPMFFEMASWPAGEPPDMEKLGALCAEFGISFV